MLTEGLQCDLDNVILLNVIFKRNSYHVKQWTTVLKIIRQFVKMLMLCKNDVEQLSAICIPNHFDINKDNLEIVLFP